MIEEAIERTDNYKQIGGMSQVSKIIAGRKLCEKMTTSGIVTANVCVIMIVTTTIVKRKFASIIFATSIIDSNLPKSNF